jgi:ParB-like chromosome segregation protein Spo0J
MKIEIKNIIIPEGHRPLDQAKVAEIANSIKMIGLLHPIGMSLKNGVATLVFGAHRLAACRSLGWKKIAVVEPVDILTAEDSYLDDYALEMMEIAENLHRCELTTSQRNEHLARWVDLIEKRKPDIAAAASISKPGRKPSRAVAEVAKLSGLGRQAVKEAIKTAKLSPEVKAAADDAELSHKQRLTIARLPEAEQLSAVAKQAAIKAKADRAEATAAAKTPKPVRDVKPTADCAEAKAKPGVVAADPAVKDSPDDDASTLIGVLAWFERIRAPIELEASIGEMSGSDLVLLDAQIVRVQTWIGQIAVISAGVTRACGIVS